MNFNKHFEIEGKHAFLSPSSYHWLNYDDDKLIETFSNEKAKERGTRLHAFAESAIRDKIKLARYKKTLYMYVNDAIGFNMTPEQPLKYSNNCFGTTDAISCRDNQLKIKDLKTGTTPAHMEQLLIYAALFFLEYNLDPREFMTELSIYQNDDVQVMEPLVEDIREVMDIIKHDDELLEKVKKELEE